MLANEAIIYSMQNQLGFLTKTERASRSTSGLDEGDDSFASDEVDSFHWFNYYFRKPDSTFYYMN